MSLETYVFLVMVTAVLAGYLGTVLSQRIWRAIDRARARREARRRRQLWRQIVANEQANNRRAGEMTE